MYNARHHPPRTQPRNHPSLAHEINAIRGRGHADIRPLMRFPFSQRVHLTPGISGAHRRLMIKDLLIARLLACRALGRAGG
ncbi:MAG: hypothetical protein M3Q91_00915 [Acidobacteriota bacterium]|nr:hypothetical protein [Acidobacteriota bacterium]